jgi:plastocyanin
LNSLSFDFEFSFLFSLFSSSNSNFLFVFCLCLFVCSFFFSFARNFVPPIDVTEARYAMLRAPVGGSFYDNSTSYTVSSGLVGLGGPNYTLTLTSTGVFPYFCAIHPSMYASITVHPVTDSVLSLPRTPAQVIELGNTQINADRAYALGTFVTQTALNSQYPYVTNADGTTRTFTISNGIYAAPIGGAAGVGPISAYDFYPGNGELQINVGDSVVFINRDMGIHTLVLQTDTKIYNFEDQTNPTPFLVAVIPTGSSAPFVYTGGYTDLGISLPTEASPPGLNFDRKTVKFATAGVYQVYCSIHASLGMKMVITVNPPTNWLVRVGGGFGEDVDGVTPGAPYYSMKFYPAQLDIRVGDTVTWQFESSEPHSVR